MPGLTELPPFQSLYPMLLHFARIALIFIGAFIAAKVVAKSIPRLRAHMVEVMIRRGGGANGELEKRAATLGAILRKAIVVVVWVVAIIMALKEAGFDVGPMLAGAGVAGLAVGFGAQNLVRDVISGLFLLIENQIRVKDVAIINGTGGLVEEINLRTTVLRGLDGTVHIFPNGSINTLSNMTHEYSYYLFDIGVAYKEDTDHVVEVVKQIADEMMQEEQYRALILAPLEVLGVDKFADSAVIIKARIKTKPINQWTVGREMNRRIKKEFDKVGIEIPFPHQSLYFGEASKPIRIQMEQADRQELKSLIREVLKEHTDEYSLAYRAKLESRESVPTQDQSLRDSERPSRLAEAGTAQREKSAIERVPRILDPDQSSDAPESGE